MKLKKADRLVADARGIEQLNADHAYYEPSWTAMYEALKIMAFGESVGAKDTLDIVIKALALAEEKMEK